MIPRLSLALFTLALVACCHSDTQTGTGFSPCETCELRTLPVDLVCSKNAQVAAQNDALSKARARCGKNRLETSAFEVERVECVKRGNQWFVQAIVRGHFKCCS